MTAWKADEYSPLHGILLMLVSTAFFSAMNMGIHALSATMHPLQMVFLRNLICLIFSAILLVVTKTSARTTKLTGHLGRSVVGFVAMTLWFYSVSIMDVTLATALGFTTPIFSTIIAIVVLGETVGFRRWLAIIMGFIGMIVVLQPWHTTPDANVLFVLASSAAMAVAGVLIKSLTRSEAPITIVFYAVLFMTPFSFPGAWMTWRSISSDQWWLVSVIGICAMGGQLSLTYAFRAAELTLLMPFDFTRLLFTSLFAALIFNEQPAITTFLGAFIIVASSVYIAHREAVLKRKTTKLLG